MVFQAIKNIKIRGICSAVPKEYRVLHDEYQEMGEEWVIKNSQETGVIKRHIAPSYMCASDLACQCIDVLLKKLNWEANSVDVLILITQTPDYLLPNTSSVIHSRLNFSQNTVVFDINLGCSGYVYGLWIAANLISSGSLKRGLIVVADTPSKVIQPSDFALRLLFGDAASVTAIEYHEKANEISFNLKSDGSGFDSLIVPQGLFRELKYNNDISQERLKCFSKDSHKRLYMQGSEIMSFALTQVPKVINELLDSSRIDASAIDYWVMHQASKLLLKFLTKKINISDSKMIFSIEEFGNTSSVTIPLTISHKLSHILTQKKQKIMLVGFGVGLSWAAAIVDCDSITMPEILYVV
ncbi:MAG: ketoacyl-ACP synthase III [Silvanigrellaceae bacterium]|nr:ketoacyl-ACP synthase III [Silvanigrellaceae bacterium]